MTRKLDEASRKKIEQALSERFGDPIIGVQMPRLVEAALCEGCGCMKQLEEEEACSECGTMEAEIDESWGSNRNPPWQPPADPNKTWISSIDGARRGYCRTCKGRGKIENSSGNLTVCYGCKGQKIVTLPNTEGVVKEARSRVSPQEVEATWEDLYMQLGIVGLAELSSWLAAPEEVVAQAINKVGWLAVDNNGNVVEKGLSEPPPAN